MGTMIRMAVVVVGLAVATPAAAQWNFQGSDPEAGGVRAVATLGFGGCTSDASGVALVVAIGAAAADVTAAGGADAFVTRHRSTIVELTDDHWKRLVRGFEEDEVFGRSEAFVRESSRMAETIIASFAEQRGVEIALRPVTIGRWNDADCS